MGRMGTTRIHFLSASLYYIFMDLFYFEEYIDFTGYTDDTTPCSADSSIDNTIVSLISYSAWLFNWFQQNAMKANPNKCHLLLSTNQNKLVNLNSNANHKSSSEKLLGITIVLYWIQYKNSLKYKFGYFWRFSHIYTIN